jgi:D-threonate/D-erythronate kinase
MIAVIADDLTGAAELAGIALRYHLQPEVVTEMVDETKADLLVISMDSRSMNKQDAVQKATDTTIKLAALHPEMMFKKVDSALRGYIVEEIAAHLNILHLKKALLIPANPALGRQIIDGIYLLNNQPIHLTGFSKDPEFPVTTSRVTEMIPSNVLKVALVKPGEPKPDAGIIVGEVNNPGDLDYWAKQRQKDLFLAGASGFFTALLQSLDLSKKAGDNRTAVIPGIPSLYVCGSAFTKSLEAVHEIKMKGGPVSYMPVELVSSIHNKEKILDDWSGEVVRLLNQYGKAIIGIDAHSLRKRVVNAKLLREITAACVHAVYNKVRLAEVVIEGGSTASSVVSMLGFNRFLPVQEITHGVVRMQVECASTLFLTIKPGSYAWSTDIWTF